MPGSTTLGASFAGASGCGKTLRIAGLPSIRATSGRAASARTRARSPFTHTALTM
jgi:hypothetical protein